MTAFSLLTRLIGVLLRLYLSARVGSEGMGLYQLVMSVYGLFATLATGGLTVAVSRLSAEKAERNLSDAVRVLRSGILLGAVVSVCAAAVLWAGAGVLAERLLLDARCAFPLRILAFSLPCMAAAACFKGWFIARRQVLRGSSASLFEQCVKFAVMAWFLGVWFSGTNDVGKLCTGIVFGVTLGECASFLYLLAAYYFLRGRVKRKEFAPSESRKSVSTKVRSVVLPIGASVAVTSLLHTAESLLIPFAFERFGGDRGKALSEFGMIRGMAIPLLFFPFAFLGSLVSVMIPEVSRLNSPQTQKERDRRIGRTISLTFLFSIPVGGLFFFLAPELGETFYPGQGTAEALRILAPVTPFMYVQTICDGLLKAIDGQKYTLLYSLYNSALRIAVILLLIPLTGSEGYLALLIASNTFEFLLCFRRLRKSAPFSLPAGRFLLLPTLASCAAGFAARGILRAIGFAEGASPLLPAVCGTAVYVLVAGCVSAFAAVGETEKEPKRKAKTRPVPVPGGSLREGAAP